MKGMVYRRLIKRCLYASLFLIAFNSCQNSDKKTVSVENINTDSTEQNNLQRKEAEISYDKSDTLVKMSKPFILNGINCFWEFDLTVYEGQKGGNGINRLKNHNTNKVLLINEDYFDLELFNSIDKNNFDFNGEFKDANFDSLKDFIVYSRTGSGSGGAMFKVYLFNKKKGVFEFSEELSGGEFEINEAEKTVSTYWKMGVGWNTTAVTHFDNSKTGKIKFVEVTTREVIWGDSINLLKTTNKKISNGKIVKLKIDTTVFEGY